MVSTSFMVDTSSHPRAQLHRCVERSAYVCLSDLSSALPLHSRCTRYQRRSFATCREFRTARITRTSLCLAWTQAAGFVANSPGIW